MVAKKEEGWVKKVKGLRNTNGNYKIVKGI